MPGLTVRIIFFGKHISGEPKEEPIQGPYEAGVVQYIEDLNDVLKSAPDQLGLIPLYKPRLDVLKKELIEERGTVVLHKLAIRDLIGALIQVIYKHDEFSELLVLFHSINGVYLSQLLVEVQVRQVFGLVILWVA